MQMYHAAADKAKAGPSLSLSSQCLINSVCMQHMYVCSRGDICHCVCCSCPAQGWCMVLTSVTPISSFNILYIVKWCLPPYMLAADKASTGNWLGQLFPLSNGFSVAVRILTLQKIFSMKLNGWT